MSPSLYPDKKTFATIQSYDDDSKSYTVMTHGAKGDSGNGSGRVLKGVPRMTPSPSDKSVLPNDTVVVIDFDVGIPLIAGVVPINAKRQYVDEVPNTAPDMGGFEETGKSTQYTGGYYRQPDDPRNVFSGDWCRSSPDGNFVAALRGKLSKVYGSERAQIIASGFHNLVRTVCENYEHFSSFGDLTIYNKNGRCNLKFVGAADQLNESGGQEQNWTFHLDIGDEGNLFNMRITSSDGRSTNAEFSISPDGVIEMFGKNGWTQVTAGTLKQTVGVDLVRRVTGSDRKVVGEASSHKYDSDLDQDVAENLTSNVGNNELNTIGGNQTNLISKQRIETITGGAVTEATPTNIACEVNLINGSYDVHVGSPAKASSPLALAGYHVYTYNGAIVLGENLNPAESSTPFSGNTGVSVSLNTRGLGSVGLGCRLPPFNNPLTESSNPATDSAMLFIKWQAWANKLIQLLDTHVHPTAWGPSLAAQVPVGTNLGFAAQLAGLIMPVKSLRVVIGA